MNLSLKTGSDSVVLFHGFQSGFDLPVAGAAGVANDFFRREIEDFLFRILHLLDSHTGFEPLQNRIVAAGIGEESDRLAIFCNAHAADANFRNRYLARFSVDGQPVFRHVQFLQLGAFSADPVTVEALAFFLDGKAGVLEIRDGKTDGGNLDRILALGRQRVFIALSPVRYTRMPTGV